MGFFEMVAVILILELIRFYVVGIIRNFNNNRPLREMDSVPSAVRVGIAAGVIGNILPIFRWILISAYLLSMLLLYPYIVYQNKVKNKDDEERYAFIVFQLRLWRKGLAKSAVTIYGLFILIDLFLRN